MLTAVETEHQLTDREREILRLVVKSFVDTADPVGSRFLARRFDLGLSAASIRNTMSDLEELGYLGHPYTSAGRIPTERGYRKFVDELMDTVHLSVIEKQLLRNELDRLVGDTQDMLRESSRLLARFSNLLGIVLTPRLATSVLGRLEVVQLSSSRAMFVLSLHGGLVKTVTFELDSDIDRENMDRIVSTLNERLSGLTLEEIRLNFEPRVRDLDDDRTGIVRLVLAEAPVLFSDHADRLRLQYGGTQNMLKQPEFQEASDMRKLIELMDNEISVVRLLEDRRSASTDPNNARAVITIGRENTSEHADKCSVVTAQYRIGDTIGTIGVIGPTRMDYARVVALVESMADLLSKTAEG